MKKLLLLGLLTVGVWAQPALTPLPNAAQTAPKITEVKKVRMVTTMGTILIEVYPQAAPNASKRFLELVQAGFYDFTPIFRVVPGFVAQFGINWRDTNPEWQNRNFKDDPSLFKLDKGTLAFAKAGPDTNSTQVFINFGDNSRLATQGNFTTFAKVVEGGDIPERFQAVGDPSMGLDQDALWRDGKTYLGKLKDQPAYILFAEVL